MIREGVAKRLKELLGVEDIPLNVPPKREMGDISSAICLSLAKEKRRPPTETAGDLEITGIESSFIREITVTPQGI
jgi:arginyl-tRNA synthetase